MVELNDAVYGDNYMSNIFTGLLSGVGNLATTAATDAANIGMADLNRRKCKEQRDYHYSE